MNWTSFSTLAQQPGGGANGGSSIVFWVIYIAIIAIVIVGVWKVFEKAGKPGWASIVPIYNIIVLMEIVGKPTWWVLLYFIPCVNFIIGIIVAIELAKVFGKGGGFAAGLILLPFVFYPILGFGDARYQGASASY
jgi:hypothetical protein